jgi:hypothetical protein
MRKIEADFEAMLLAGELRVPPLQLQIVTTEPSVGEDAVLDVFWQDQSDRYLVELKRDAKPQTLRLAQEQAKEWARRSGKGRPMVIAPYLTSQKLDELLNEGVSALDFCGNGAVESPGRFLFYKTGNPNRYRDSAPITSAYRGDGSLIPRVLLLNPEFQAIRDIQTAITARGGSITLGTVSKVLQRLEADLAIERPNRNSVRVIQPDRILDGLRDAYRPPKIKVTWTGKVAMAGADLLARMEGLSAGSDLVRTGESSAGDYAAWAGEPVVACYCRARPSALLEELGADAKETRAFANLRLLQTQDQRVYFDRRPNRAASPIQSWLEMASGDKRQKEVAEQIRRLILDGAGAGL